MRFICTGNNFVRVVSNRLVVDKLMCNCVVFLYEEVGYSNSHVINLNQRNFPNKEFLNSTLCGNNDTDVCISHICTYPIWP